MQAALTRLAEIGFTIVSMTLSLAAVFIPILFMAGILGRLFREFAVTICAAILISGHGLDQPDADAVQPLPARHADRQARPAVPRRSRASSTACCTSTSAACAGCCATAR